MNLVLLGKPGWGKSYMAQCVLEKNLRDYAHSVTFDQCDEFRGLVKVGLAKHMIVSQQEVGLSVATWRRILQANPHIIIAKVESLPIETWKQVVATVSEAARGLDREQLLTYEEAHFLAPQRGKTPKPIEHVATTGRGGGTSSIWITQRPSKLEETILSCAMSRYIGGFESDADLGKIDGITEYPTDIHNPQSGAVTGVAPELDTDDRDNCLSKFTDDEGNTIGSEWVYSDDDGNRSRVDSRKVTMESTHYGQQGKGLEIPGR